MPDDTHVLHSFQLSVKKQDLLLSQSPKPLEVELVLG